MRQIFYWDFQKKELNKEIYIKLTETFAKNKRLLKTLCNTDESVIKNNSFELKLKYKFIYPH